jgi:hypothetical protein
MPTALRSGTYGIYTWSHERDEPAHMHVDRDDLSARFWLQPVALAANYGFRPVELRKIQRILEANEQMLVEAWLEHHGP